MGGQDRRGTGGSERSPATRRQIASKSGSDGRNAGLDAETGVQREQAGGLAGVEAKEISGAIGVETGRGLRRQIRHDRQRRLRRARIGVPQRNGLTVLRRLGGAAGGHRTPRPRCAGADGAAALHGGDGRAGQCTRHQGHARGGQQNHDQQHCRRSRHASSLPMPGGNVDQPERNRSCGKPLSPWRHRCGTVELQDE